MSLTPPGERQAPGAIGRLGCRPTRQPTDLRSGGREPQFGVLGGPREGPGEGPGRSPGGSKLGSWRGSPGGLEFSGKKRIFVIFEKL